MRTLKVSKNALALLLALGLCLAFSPDLRADAVTGDVNTVGAVTLNSNSISFLSTGGVANQFTVSIPITMTPTPPANSTGTIQNLNNVAEPIGTPFSLPNWMVFNGAPIVFTLQFINPGNGDFTAADCGSTVTGHACTIPGSALNLLNEGSSGGTATAVGLSFSLTGLATDTAPGGQTDDFVGSFSNAGPVVDLTTGATLTNVGAFIAAESAGNNLQMSYSGSFSAFQSAASPEPSMLPMFLVGLSSLVCLRLKRKRA